MFTAIEVAKRSNQRGGRMLSVVDLLEAGTLCIPQAAWLLARILRGSSWVVGARPGGAGKTTVMSALLAMVPRDSRLWLTSKGSGWQNCRAGDTLVSYELCQGFYEAYIWGADVVRLTELGLTGCRIVSNLHADTLAQAREQVVGECGASEEGFQAFQMFIPLSLKGSRYSAVPVVERIDYVRNGSWCQLRREEAERAVTEETEQAVREELAAIADFLADCCRKKILLIEDLRGAWLDWCDQ
jgi:hypothetical protein